MEKLTNPGFSKREQGGKGGGNCLRHFIGKEEKGTEKTAKKKDVAQRSPSWERVRQGQGKKKENHPNYTAGKWKEGDTTLGNLSRKIPKYWCQPRERGEASIRSEKGSL